MADDAPRGAGHERQEGAGQAIAPFEFSWDMSISRGEFERCLPAAVGHVSYVTSGDVFAYCADGRAWRITLEPLPDRVIALLRLPRHRVSFRFEGYDDAARAAWLERFQRHFQRGGG